jgi:hypothetical protein
MFETAYRALVRMSKEDRHDASRPGDLISIVGVTLTASSMGRRISRNLVLFPGLWLFHGAFLIFYFFSDLIEQFILHLVVTAAIV